MERVLLLKRVPLFRHLPLDTLLAVSRALERRQYLAGETIIEADARWDHFWIVERGAVELFTAGGGPSSCAPRPISASWSWPTSRSRRRAWWPPATACCCGCIGSCSMISAVTTPRC